MIILIKFRYKVLLFLLIFYKAFLGLCEEVRETTL